MWTGRVRNIAADESLGGIQLVGAMAAAVAFVAGGLVLLGVAAARRSAPQRGRRLVIAVCTAMTMYWLVRMALIVSRDHSLGFVVVHAVLAVASMTAAAWVLHHELFGLASTTRVEETGEPPVGTDITASLEREEVR